MSEIHSTAALIPFATRSIGSETVNTVNARDLYAYLALTGDYNLWIKRAIKRANLQENIDFVVSYQVVENPRGGRPATEHHLSFDAAKHVAMMSSAEKGHEVRAWFIAKEKELAATKGDPYAILNNHPELRAITELAVSTAQAREEAARATLVAEAAKQDAAEARAEAREAGIKAEMAMERATVEAFILGNKLLPQFPMSQWGRIGTWLGQWCDMYGLEVLPVPVVAKQWPTENSYPLPAFAAWLRMEQRKPQQIRLVEPDRGGNSTTRDPEAAYAPRRRGKGVRA